jgi:hypothetical protein
VQNQIKRDKQMGQTKILELIEKEGVVFTIDIVNALRNGDSCGESLKKHLKQLRKYKEVNFVKITFANASELAKQFPKLEERLASGHKIRRPEYMYFSIKLRQKGGKNGRNCARNH